MAKNKASGIGATPPKVPDAKTTNDKPDAKLVHGKTDADFVQEAYGDSLKLSFKNYVGSLAGNSPGAETRFRNGLEAARMARQISLKAAESLKLTTPFKSDEELIQDAYGERLKALFSLLDDDCRRKDPHAKNTYTSELAIIRNAREQAIKLLAQQS